MSVFIYICCGGNRYIDLIPDRMQPITQRACHSPWRAINQKLLFFIRAVLTAYLTSVAGVALKYKLESQDDHTSWRIPFQFSTVAFVLQWAYNLVTLVSVHYLRVKSQFIKYHLSDEG
jgi:predicted small integral membrane protein